jgi:hypothetical protein
MRVNTINTIFCKNVSANPGFMFGHIGAEQYVIELLPHSLMRYQ